MAVYFAHIDPPNGPVKIGYSAWPQKRIAGIASYYKKDVLLFCVIAGGPEREGAVHEQFAAHRIEGRGETFRTTSLTNFPMTRLKSPIWWRYRTKAQAKRVPVLMTPERVKLVGDHLNGRNGKKQLSGPKIAKKLGVSTASVYGYWKQAGKGRFVRRRPK